MSAAPPSTPPHAVILGCGVIGLTTALLLQRHGIHVTIRAHSTPLTSPSQPADAYTSDKAGAHWFSFASDTEIKTQAEDELCFHALKGLAVTEPNSGVQIVRGHTLYEANPDAAAVVSTTSNATAVSSSSFVTPSLPWWHILVPRFHVWTQSELDSKSRASSDILRGSKSNVHIKYTAGFSYESVMVHVPQYLLFLYNQFLAAGGEIQLGKVERFDELWMTASSAAATAASSSASSSTTSATSTSHSSSTVADIYINCSGLGSSTLLDIADTSLSPDRGQTILIRLNDPNTIRDIWRCPAVRDGEQTTYVLPRGDGTVLLGGTHDKRSDVLHDSTVATSILTRCARLIPTLRDPSTYTILKHQVGLRPGRSTRRVEVDEKLSRGSKDSQVGDSASRLVLHAYGHGGDGYQSSWGTASVLLHLISQARPHFFTHPPQATFAMRYEQVKTGLVKKASMPDVQRVDLKAKL